MDDENSQSLPRSGEVDESSFQLETLLKSTAAPKQSMRTRFLGGGSKEKESPYGKTDKKASPRGTTLRGTKGPKTQVKNRELEGYPFDYGYGGNDE